jgi:hypothetical protein
MERQPEHYGRSAAEGMPDRDVHERHPTYFQVRVTAIEDPEFTASGPIVDLSQSEISVYLPLEFTPGSVVRLNINDSLLFGFVAYSTPQRSYFHTGIELVPVLIGGPDLSLMTALEKAVRDVERLETLP